MDFSPYKLQSAKKKQQQQKKSEKRLRNHIRVKRMTRFEVAKMTIL